jgi:hypothetical protein
MNIKKMRESVEKLKEDMGDGLLAADIFSTADGQSIYGFNSNAKACALFNQVTSFLSRSLKGSNFPPLGKYYIVDLADFKMVLVIPMDEYQWGMLVDTKKTQTGLLLNVILPEIVDKFEDALAG